MPARYDVTSNFHGGNASSVAANAATPEAPRQNDRERITALLKATGGMICEEIESRTGMPHESASARLRELKNEGTVVVLGKRKTSRGRFAGINHLTSMVALLVLFVLTNASASALKPKSIPFVVHCGLCSTEAKEFAQDLTFALLVSGRYHQADPQHLTDERVLSFDVSSAVEQVPGKISLYVIGVREGEVVSERVETCSSDSITACADDFVQHLPPDLGERKAGTEL
jgi:hypothetical protein